MLPLRVKIDELNGWKDFLHSYQLCLSSNEPRFSKIHKHRDNKHYSASFDQLIRRISSVSEKGNSQYLFLQQKYVLQFTFLRRYIINFIFKCRSSIFRSNIHTVSIICIQEWYNIITRAWKIIDLCPLCPLVLAMYSF